MTFVIRRFTSVSSNSVIVVGWLLMKFSDEQLAAAMIDRIVHFGHLIDTGKVDWRLKLSPMNQQMVEKKIDLDFLRKVLNS